MTPRPTAPVPDGWRAVRLGDVADVTFSSVDKKTVDGELPVRLCNYTDVFYNRRILPEMPLMSATATPVECEKWALSEGDVLFTKDSETADEIGIPSYVAKDMPNVLCGYHLGLARPVGTSTDGAFLARALGSQAAARDFSRIANGITRFGLTLDATRSLPLLLPPIPEQRAIAAVLDSIDEAIERTEEVIAATERLRDALLHELLTRGLPGHHTAWREVPGLGAIPACWEVVRLGDATSEIRYGTSSRLSPEGTWSVLRIPNVARGFVDLRDLKYADLSPREAHTLALKQGDLLLVRTNGNPEICGASAVWEGLEGHWAFASYLLRLRTARERLISTYLWSFLRSTAGRRQLSGSIRTSAGNYNLSAEGLAASLLPLPPLPEQRAIAATLDTVDSTIERARAERAALQSSKASTADALLTGRVRVGWVSR